MKKMQLVNMKDLIELYAIYTKQSNQENYSVTEYHENSHDNSGGHPNYHNNSHDNMPSMMRMKLVKAKSN